MDLQPIPEMIGDLPNLCGAWDKVKEVTQQPCADLPERDQLASGPAPGRLRHRPAHAAAA